MAKLLTKELGHNVIVENRTGADGIIMINQLLKAPVDGHVIAANTLTLASLFGEPTANFKPDDLQMVARSTDLDPYGLIVPASIPFRSIDEFVKHARQHPNKFNVGGPFQMGSHRVAWEQFAQCRQDQGSTGSPTRAADPRCWRWPAVTSMRRRPIRATSSRSSHRARCVCSRFHRKAALGFPRRAYLQGARLGRRALSVARHHGESGNSETGARPARCGNPESAANPGMESVPAAGDAVDGFMGPAEFKAQLMKDIHELETIKKKLGIQ